MLIARELQDAGRERPLSSGQVYDLPATVATSLIATGVAVAEELDAKAIEAAPENKALVGSPARKRR